ncbi:MAG: metal-dependent transcriptional regulator [Candidatus Vecturithrix sp.]|nr:metal-dependent transcriptional regulator [Candidatus Vecturithrix sp.]
MEKAVELSPSLEDYLEAIHLLQKRKRAVRVKDISHQLGVKASSVNGAISALSQKGLVLHEHYGYIELAKEGRQLAQNVQERHTALLTFLTDILGIPRYIAAKEACAMEHHISNQTLQRLSKFIAFALSATWQDNSPWLQRFHQILACGGQLEKGEEQ